MAVDLTILYRGPLSSCNYDCHYCPFAKRHETAAELRTDRLALERFRDWILSRSGDSFSILFTPWGEAMTRRWYRDTLVQLTHHPAVRRAAIQTNLSWDPDWADQCDLNTLGLWCTWHPDQAGYEEFLSKCHRLYVMGARLSVGIVGLNQHYDAAAKMRRELPKDVYLWINAYKDRQDYYNEDDCRRWTELDPLFPVNNTRHESLGRACRTGESAVSIDGEGNVYRCHFIKECLGNIYEQPLESMLRRRPCTNATCGCHIGYVHLESLDMYPLYGEGLLERIPNQPLWQLSPRPQVS